MIEAGILPIETELTPADERRLFGRMAKLY